MFSITALSLVVTGAGILVHSLVPLKELMAQLPPGPMRRRWRLMTGLTVFFVFGYLSFAGAFWQSADTWLHLIVPSVFFFGACFVWLTASLSLRTAVDLRRMMILEQESITDPLMGVYNRRYADRRLEEEFARAERHSLPLSVLILDIDNFKRVNDDYGHQVGDRVLQCVGSLILEAVRASDVVARYGGEEVIILAPDTTQESATGLAERLRQHVESHELVVSSQPGDRRTVRVTVCVGVAGLRNGADSVERLVSRADEAMYQAKEAGRNRVVTASSAKPQRISA